MAFDVCINLKLVKENGKMYVEQYIGERRIGRQDITEQVLNMLLGIVDGGDSNGNECECVEETKESSNTI